MATRKAAERERKFGDLLKRDHTLNGGVLVGPEQLVKWMTAHEHADPKYGWVYRYHSRSDAHSIALCGFVLNDLLEACPLLREHGRADRSTRGSTPSIDAKSLDLAIGTTKPWLSTSACR